MPQEISCVRSTALVDSRRSPGSCEQRQVSRGYDEISMALRRRASLLGWVYGRFTEGFETADLREAKTLLGQSA